jgi:hypothetical protein
MGRRPRVERTPEEKWQIVQEGIKSGNVSETCPAAWHFTVTAISMEGRSGGRSKGSAWGEKRCRAGETEKDQRIRQLERTLGRKSLEIEILKNVVGE